MRPLAVIAGALLAVALCFLAASAVVSTAKRDAQLHNPYWPFSVEMSVRDR